jgi:hypothetical protein
MTAPARRYRKPEALAEISIRGNAVIEASAEPARPTRSSTSSSSSFVSKIHRPDPGGDLHGKAARELD